MLKCLRLSVKRFSFQARDCERVEIDVQYLKRTPSFAMAYTTLGIGNIEPNMLTVKAAIAPTATTYFAV